MVIAKSQFSLSELAVHDVLNMLGSVSLSYQFLGETGTIGGNPIYKNLGTALDGVIELVRLVGIATDATKHAVPVDELTELVARLLVSHLTSVASSPAECVSLLPSAAMVTANSEIPGCFELEKPSLQLFLLEQLPVTMQVSADGAQIAVALHPRLDETSAEL